MAHLPGEAWRLGALGLRGQGLPPREGEFGGLLQGQEGGFGWTPWGLHAYLIQQDRSWLPEGAGCAEGQGRH